MRSKFFGLLFFLCNTFGWAQELNCDVTVNTDKVAQTNNQVFKALQSSVRDFMNNTKFTSINYSKSELIDCFITMNVISYENNTMTVMMRVGSSRPVYHSTYNSPVFSYSEESVSFSYIEYEPLTYSENSYTSELVAILSFYAHMMIGLDADTFSPMGGTESLQKANNVVNYSQSYGGSGWQQSNSLNSRYYLINDILSNNFTAYRQALYDYHRKGLDVMANDPATAKQAIYNALQLLDNNHKVRPNNLPNRTFFDAKSDEIVNIYSAGPEFDKQPLIDLLNSINPMNSGKWYRL